MGFGVTGIIQNLGGIDGSSMSDKDLYGTKPVVPKAIDYSSALQDAVNTNISLLPSLQQLGLLSTDALTAMLERSLPGYTGIRDQTTGILSSKLKGEIPKDVQQLLERNAAERGVTMGTSGSQLSEFDTLRNLGLTSLSIQNEGVQQGSNWLSQNRGNAFDFTKMFLGSQDAIRKTEFNWQRDWLSNQIKAAPDPQARGAYDAEMGFLGEVLSVYSGGAGYQQTYRPNYGGGGGGGGGGGWGGGGGRASGYNSYFGGGPQGDFGEGTTSGAEY